MSIVTMYAGDPYEKETINPTSATSLSRSKLHPDRLGSSKAAGMQAKAAYITVEDATVCVSFEGTDAVAANDHEFAAGDSFLITGAVSLNQLSMIDKAGASKVKVTYYF